jgi:hypothetical protein
VSRIYKAPWGFGLTAVSTLVTLLAAGILLASVFTETMPAAAGWLAPLLVSGTVPFVVRSYRIEAGEIRIRRLFWETRLEILTLAAAEFQPGAMSKSLRICGNGGAFSFTGWFWNRRLGKFRAFVTDFRRTVVLRFPEKTVLVSPDAPEDFVRELNRRRG